MTKTTYQSRHFDMSKIKNCLVILLFFIITIILILNQNVLRKSINNSLRMCLSSIVPSIFPFMILSDFLTGNLKTSKDYRFCKWFGKLFSMNESAMLPFILGNICGFPLGAKSTIDLYKNGSLTKEECERLIGFANNPSLAFVISGVGMGMRGSVTEGVLLYCVILISSFILGISTRSKNNISSKPGNISKQNFSIVTSIKNSTIAIIYVCSYIIFFSFIADIAIKYLNAPLVSALFISFLEIGTATNYIAGNIINETLSLSLTAFALAFSGLSVYLQTLSFAPSEIKKGKCLVMKMCQGLVAFTITLILKLLL